MQDIFNENILIILDVDECSLGSYKCHAYSKCTNTIGSYKCKCLGGYYSVRDICKGIKLTFK